MTLVAVAALSLMLAGCSDGPGSAGDPASSSNSQSDSTAQPDGSGDAAAGTATLHGADLAITQFATSWLDAVDIAKAQFDGGVTEIELDWNHNRYAYKIELASATDEYEVRIDADTGETISESTESIDADDVASTQAEVIDLSRVVSWEDALASALSAQAGVVDEWKLEGKSEGPQYEFDIVDDSGEDFEVTLDALTDNVLRVED